jgi:S1-C subfamily serine protease
MRKYIEAAGLGLLLIYSIFKLPQIHYKILRGYVSSKVVTIGFTDMRFGGGTGVHIKLPSGKTAILTNAHVCGIKDSNNQVMIYSDQLERPIPRKVIEVSDFTDLCLVEGIEGINGLSLGSDANPGDIVATIGHPLLMPNVMSRGEIVAVGEAEVFDHLMPAEDDGSCKLKKNKMIKVDTIFGPMNACFIDLQAIYTTIPTFPGNSGSPAVNALGNVVGLVFAGSSETHWGILITLKDIKQFLAPY